MHFVKYKLPGTCVHIWRRDLTEGFLRYCSRGLIHGGVYFRNFTLFIHFNFPAVIPGIVVVITSLAQPDSYGLYKTKNSTEVL